MGSGNAKARSLYIVAYPAGPVVWIDEGGEELAFSANIGNVERTGILFNRRTSVPAVLTVQLGELAFTPAIQELGRPSRVTNRATPARTFSQPVAVIPLAGEAGRYHILHRHTEDNARPIRLIKTGSTMSTADETERLPLFPADFRIDFTVSEITGGTVLQQNDDGTLERAVWYAVRGNEREKGPELFVRMQREDVLGDSFVFTAAPEPLFTAESMPLERSHRIRFESVQVTAAGVFAQDDITGAILHYSLETGKVLQSYDLDNRDLRFAMHPGGTGMLLYDNQRNRIFILRRWWS
jgi:hypothetical protein